MKKVKTISVSPVKVVKLPRRGWEKRDYGGGTRGIRAPISGGAINVDVIRVTREEWNTWDGVLSVWNQKPTFWSDE